MYDPRITEEARAIKAYIDRVWGKLFTTRLEVQLNELFPEPGNSGLKHIWRYGTADLVVYRHGKPIAMIEPGGTHHFDEKQSLNDRRKWKLAELNGVKCLSVMNSVRSGLSTRKWRALLGSHLFAKSQAGGCSLGSTKASIKRKMEAE